jgi:hypothetical protein
MPTLMTSNGIIIKAWFAMANIALVKSEDVCLLQEEQKQKQKQKQKQLKETA